MSRMRSTTMMAALAVALSLAMGTAARASGIPRNFDQVVTISAAPGSEAVAADPTAGSATVTSGDATVTLTGLSGIGGDASGLGTDVVLGTISATKADVGVTNVSLNYNIRVRFDDPTGALISDYADIKGTISGTIEKFDSGSMAMNLHNTYSPTLGTLTSQEGGYVVSDGMFTRPGVREGQFGAHVKASGIPLPAPVPEPTSLALWGALGLGAIGLRRHRRKMASA